MSAIVFFLTASAIDFYVDPVVFRVPVAVQDSAGVAAAVPQYVSYAEFNCEIPYQDLYFTEADSQIVARTEIRFKLFDSQRNDSLTDVLRREFRIASFKTAAREELTFIVQFGTFVSSGTYRYEISIFSGTNGSTVIDSLVVGPATDGFSDVLLASAISRDTSGGYLCKGDLRVVPRPSRVFKEKDNALFAYYEVYRSGPSDRPVLAAYEIVDSTGKVIRHVSQTIKLAYSVQSVNAGLNIQNLPAGPYRFRLSLSDSGGASRNEEIPFMIRKRAVLELSYEGMPYYDEIEYFVSPKEYGYFKALDKAGQANYLKKFWSTRNYHETAEKFGTAHEKFKEGNKPGYKTDRGRVYIKYGEPDEVEESTIKIEVSKPYKQWDYYNGVKFIFVDIRGTNEYVLVWTNAPDERSQPSLYTYLSDEKRRELNLK